MKKRIEAILNHELEHGVYVCGDCGRYRVEKVIAKPKRLPQSLKKEYCPVCETNTEFMKIG